MCLSQGTCHELLNLNLISMLVGCLFSNSQPIASALLLWVHIQHYKKLGVGTPWYLSDSWLTMECMNRWSVWYSEFSIRMPDCYFKHCQSSSIVSIVITLKDTILTICLHLLTFAYILIGMYYISPQKNRDREGLLSAQSFIYSSSKPTSDTGCLHHY